MQSHINTIDVPRTSPTNGFLKYQYDSALTVSGRTLTLICNNTTVYSDSRRRDLTGTFAATVPSTAGAYYFYFDADFNFVFAQNPTGQQVEKIIQTYVLVAIGAWDGSMWTVLTDERHGATKFGIDHLTEHLTIGAEYESGLGVTNITADGNGSSIAHASMTMADGRQQDEDLRHDIFASRGIAHIFNNGGVWQRFSGTGNSVLPYAIGGVPQFNKVTGGVWSIAPVPNNEYFVVYVYSVPTLAGSGLPYLYAVTASQTFANKNDAQKFATTPPQLTGLPSNEMLLCYSVLLRRSTAFTNGVQSAVVSLADGSAYYDWRKRAPSSSGGGIVLRQWALLRSDAATAANGVAPLVMRGQDGTNAHKVTGGVVDLLPNKTYIVSFGLPNDSTYNNKSLSVSTSTNGGTTWIPAFGNSSFSGAASGSGVGAGSSIADVLVTTQPTKIRINAGAGGLAWGVWLRLEVM